MFHIFSTRRPYFESQDASSEAHSRPCQSSLIENFVKIVNNWMLHLSYKYFKNMLQNFRNTFSQNR